MYNMTDMRLDDVDGTFLVLDARVVKVEASDFMLDTADRRKGGGPFRRALVHDKNDGLTVNFAGDYPGGVTVAGPVQIPGPIHLAGVAEVIPQGKRLVVRGDISYEVEGTNISGSPTTVTIIVDEELSALQFQIKQLM